MRTAFIIFFIAILSFSIFYCTSKDSKRQDVLILKEYREDGTLKTIREATIDSIPNGKTTLYYPNGKVKFILTYDTGILNGPFTFYYPSGKIKSEKNYLNDETHGNFISYYESGSIDYKGIFYKGFAVGKHYEYFDGNRIKTINDYIKYDTIERLNTFIHYDSMGRITEKTPTLEFVEDKEFLKIVIKDKLFDNVRVVSGKFDKFFVLDGMESLDTTVSKNGLTVLIPFHKGDTLRGLVDNYKIIDVDSFASRPIWFSYPNDW